MSGEPGELQDSRIATRTIDGLATTYDYDPAGQLISATTGDADTGDDLVWTYNNLGQLTETTRGETTIAQTWNADGTLDTHTSKGAVTTYGYDAAGRRTDATSTDVTQTTTYDPSGRPVDVTTDRSSGPDTTETRTYDGDGRLVEIATTHDSVPSTAELQWDDVYAPGELQTMGDRSIVTGPGGTWAQVGVTTELTSLDDLGNQVAAAGAAPAAGLDYDPFGLPTGGTEASTSAGYRGELATPSGLVHLRNRDYDLATSTFTTIDPLDGVDGTPTVANPYHYADNDPINRTDPTGLRPECGAAAWSAGECSPDFDFAWAGAVSGAGATTFCRANPAACILIAGGFFVVLNHEQLATLGTDLFETFVDEGANRREDESPTTTTTPHPTTTVVPPISPPSGEVITSYRGVKGKPGCQSGLGISSSAFRVDDDGVSTFERPFQGTSHQCLVPFQFIVPQRVPGATGPVTGLPGCTSTYTPQFGEGHWSIMCAGDTAMILSTYAKALKPIGGLETNELYQG